MAYQHPPDAAEFARSSAASARRSRGDTWDGTWLGLLSVFLAVIAIDVTIDSMVEKGEGGLTSRASW